MIEPVDVVVVGAGLSGLTAARRVAAGGASVVVLEARPRVGGRTLSEPVGAATFDLGGQWLGPTQTRAWALTRELGLATFPTHHAGEKILDVDGRLRTYRASIPSLPPHELLTLQAGLWSIAGLSRLVPLDAPSGGPISAALDRRSVGELARRFPRRVRQAFEVAVEVIFGAEPEAISLLHFLFYVRAGGGFLRLAEIERGAQQDRFVGGAQGLSLGLAARLGERVRLDTPVRAIRHVGGGVRVSTDRGELAARRVIVAVPPALVDGIELDPPLPPARRALAGSIPMGATTKVLVCYDRAFWRDRGLSGEVVTRQGPIAVTFDNTSHDGAQPALVAFIVGERAHEHARRDEATRRAVVLDALARWFGPEARTPRALVEKEWAAEPWSGGCPVGVAAPGRYLGLSGALRAAHGAVHFAGTETARVWNGYLEGAIEAGERAADEVLAALAAKGRQA